MAAKIFEQNITKLNFSFKTKVAEGGVVLTANYESFPNDSFTSEVIFALETAKEKFDADAVYFRYFNDGRGAVPQIYIYDNTNNRLTNQRKDIHIKVWSGCQVPMYIIIDKSAVNVFDAREKAKEDKENHAIETIKLTGDVIKKFSAESFDDGMFWEGKENEKRFQFEESAYLELIYGLRKVYASFQTVSGLDRHVALKLLVQCLLIKYLEEREGESKSGYFAETYFQKNFSCTNFCEVIRAGKLLNLLDQLAYDFNGKIFEWDKDSEAGAREAIGRSEVRQLAEYLDGKNRKGQYVIWRLYSFSHLPVELISSVYEALLTNSKDVVYTPEMIVSTLVDECMPLKKPVKNFKIIDVSCGSGIFLVKAYKRIIQWWRYEKWIETGRLEKPSLDTLKQLLLDGIYGIDIQEDAIRLSVFSLALALLDEVDLKPPVWQELKFPDLGEKNIVSIDFFKFITEKKEVDFDLVIGNPPFNLQTVNGKEPDRKGYFGELEYKYGYKSEIKIPDENPALHFLVQAMNLLKPDALLCFIQPSGPLLYQKDVDFKQAVFSKYNLLQVIDFTKLSNVLWGEKKVATVAVFLQKSQPDNEEVVHIIAQRTFSNVTRLFLEFDHYDFHIVNKDAVINNPYIWKANLLGGGRIISLIERLSKLRTLGGFLKEKINSNNWKYSEGYTVGNKKYYADFLYKKTSIKPKNFIETGVIMTDIEDESHFEAPRKDSREIFLAPHIIIKENIGKDAIPIDFLNYDAVFSHEIIGIYAPQKEINVLKDVYNVLIHNKTLYRFYVLVTSNRVLVGRATAILKKDIDNLPFPDEQNEIETSFTESILINDVLSYQLNNKTNLFSRPTNIEQIKVYSKIFCQTLNSVYQIENKAFRVFKILDAGKYFAVHFEYSDVNGEVKIETKNDLEDYIQQIIPTEKNRGKSSHTQKILKVYGKDCIILAKPKQLRYWLSSIALRDADETFADYIKARYY